MSPALRPARRSAGRAEQQSPEWRGFFARRPLQVLAEQLWGGPRSVTPAARILALRRGHSGSGSTGLGLDIVRRVAAASGGSLALGPTAGGGATITVELGVPPPGTP